MDQIALQFLPIKKKSWNVLNCSTLHPPNHLPPPSLSLEKTDWRSQSLQPDNVHKRYYLSRSVMIITVVSPHGEHHRDLLFMWGIIDKGPSTPLPSSGDHKNDTEEVWSLSCKNICNKSARVLIIVVWSTLSEKKRAEINLSFGRNHQKIINKINHYWLIIFRLSSIFIIYYVVPRPCLSFCGIESEERLILISLFITTLLVPTSLLLHLCLHLLHSIRLGCRRPALPLISFNLDFYAKPSFCHLNRFILGAYLGVP